MYVLKNPWSSTWSFSPEFYLGTAESYWIHHIKWTVWLLELVTLRADDQFAVEDEWAPVFQGCIHIFQWVWFFFLLLCLFLKLKQGLLQNFSLFGKVFLRRSFFFPCFGVQEILMAHSCAVTLSCHQPNFAVKHVNPWWEPLGTSSATFQEGSCGRKRQQQQQGDFGRNFPGSWADITCWNDTCRQSLSGKNGKERFELESLSLVPLLRAEGWAGRMCCRRIFHGRWKCWNAAIHWGGFKAVTEVENWSPETFVGCKQK